MVAGVMGPGALTVGVHGPRTSPTFVKIIPDKLSERWDWDQ